MILGHSDLILKNLVKGYIELPHATTMLKLTNSNLFVDELLINPLTKKTFTVDSSVAYML